MIRSAGALPRIKGRTGVLVDISGSMDAALSSKGRCCVFSDQVAILKGPLPRGATDRLVVLTDEQS